MLACVQMCVCAWLAVGGFALSAQQEVRWCTWAEEQKWGDKERTVQRFRELFGQASRAVGLHLRLRDHAGGAEVRSLVWSCAVGLGRGKV